MELHEYPRPANDTGIGVHWVAGYASAVGMGKIREFWIPELKSLGVKWVKIFNHDGAIDFAELLMAEGFMPIVRLYQPNPNPSRLGIREIVYLDALIRAGVRYFEFNHEPDVDAEWRGGHVPADGLELVVENTIANLETILERGGMPAVPALSNGSRWDLVGKIVERGRRDLFNGPVWQALHNYACNRPLDYPYDIGNQEGAAYTRRFYQVVADEPWEENAWRGRTLEEVNRLRSSRSNPGVTIAEEHACWLGYKHLDTLNQRHLGKSIPILATEGGYLVGEDVDARYPATTPDLHMAQTLEACRILMGTSQRFQPAADYFFCASFWLLANARLGANGDWWEGHAWYSERWPGGELPIVRALQAEPKVARHWQRAREQNASITLKGTVLQAAGNRTLVLEKQGVECARATLDANNGYAIPDLPPGDYVLRVAETDLSQAVELQSGKRTVILNFDLSAAGLSASNSIVTGMVHGGAGAVVILLRTSDGEEWVTLARNDGSFRFVDLPAATYSLRVHPQGSKVEDLVLDGRNQLEAELSVAGWGYNLQHVDAGPTPAPRVIRCQAVGRTEVGVRIQSANWRSELVPLNATGGRVQPREVTVPELGYYSVALVEPKEEGAETTLVEARVEVDERQVPLVIFRYADQAAEAPGSQSSIVGRVVGGLARTPEIAVVLIDDRARQLEVAVNADGEYRFDGLAKGLYSVAVAGFQEPTGRADISLDGSNQVVVDLQLPIAVESEAPDAAPSHGVVAGYAPAAAGGLATLTDNLGNEFTRLIDAHDRFRFDHLPQGRYSLAAEGGYDQGGLNVDGESGVEVLFSPLTPKWEAEVSQAGSMPGFSAVRVEVEDKRDWPVRIWQEDGVDMVQRTGENDQLGDAVAEFSPLGPGHYMVQPDQVEVWAAVELTGLEVVWVNFRQRLRPESAHLVRPLLADGSGEPASIGSAEDEAGSKIDGNHYLLIGGGLSEAALADPETLLSLLRYVAEWRPRVGRDLAAARTARRVTLFGQVDSGVEQTLLADGIRVERFAPHSASPV